MNYFKHFKFDNLKLIGNLLMNKKLTKTNFVLKTIEFRFCWAD